MHGKDCGDFQYLRRLQYGPGELLFCCFPLRFQGTIQLRAWFIGLAFLGLAVGCVFGLCLIIAYDVCLYKPQVRVQGPSQVPPEQRLYMAMIGACCLPTSLFWFGWSARPSVHWISPIAAEALFGCGNLLVFVAANLYIADCYGAKYGASAWSANTMLRYIIGAAFPLFTIQMYEGLEIPWATSLLGFLSLTFVPIPFAFYKWGPRIRASSKYQAAD